MHTLTIYNKETHEPLVVLEQQDGEMHLIGGSQKIAQGLNLSDFQSLEEIAEYVNADNSPLQAVADEGQATNADAGHEEILSETDELMARIEPALQIIRDLIERVEYRRQEQQKRHEKDELGDAGDVMGADAMLLPESPSPTST